MTERFSRMNCSVESMKYRELMIEDLPKISHLFGQRPNRSCDSAPLCSYLFKFFYMVKFCIVNDALFLSYHGDDGSSYGFIPYCREADLPEYFKLQEAYFNEVLGIPLEINSADEEGVAVLLESGALDHYTVTEVKDLRDYLYHGEDLRTLAGRKYSKKRNHINKFLSQYEGRWAYKKLSYEDRSETIAFLDQWMNQKLLHGRDSGTNELGDTFDASEELNGEYQGICNLLNTASAYEYMKIGGIYIDNVLRAFSIGVLSESCSMAIIDVEKADEVDGLYQMINREFLLHEFPDVELVNREDDVGIEGLRRAKLSYFPCGYERKFNLLQNNFSVTE